MICMENMEPSTSLQMACGHRFCNACWLSHFQVHISEGTSCSMPCMAFKCGAICDHRCASGRSTSLLALQYALAAAECCRCLQRLHGPACRIVADLLRRSKGDLLDTFEHAIVTSFIEDNASARWCPSVPCCGRAIEALDDAYCEARCECGHVFCFKCGGPAHSPATCDMWKQWEKKHSDDSETVHYLAVCRWPTPLLLAHMRRFGVRWARYFDGPRSARTLGVARRRALCARKRAGCCQRQIPLTRPAHCVLQANVKPCPKCQVPVDKDGGCNLVVCRSCRQSFCWLCGAKTGVSHTWTQVRPAQSNRGRKL